MKNLLLYLTIIFTLTSCINYTKAQNGNPRVNRKNKDLNNQKIRFNQKLADSLGADKYGMKPYVIVMLTTGATKIEDKAKMNEIMKGHMANIHKLADEGKIVVAEPFMGDNKQNFEGMFIFNTKSKDEAEQWVKTDPSVQAGVFNYEIFPWYGSAALPMYLEYHDEITKENP